MVVETETKAKEIISDYLRFILNEAFLNTHGFYPTRFYYLPTKSKKYKILVDMSDTINDISQMPLLDFGRNYNITFDYSKYGLTPPTEQ